MNINEYLSCNLKEDVKTNAIDIVKEHPYAFLKGKRIIIFVEKGQFTEQLMQKFEKIKNRKIMIGCDDNSYHIKNNYHIKCLSNKARHNFVDGIKCYWEQYNWRKFLK